MFEFQSLWKLNFQASIGSHFLRTITYCFHFLGIHGSLWSIKQIMFCIFSHWKICNTKNHQWAAVTENHAAQNRVAPRWRCLSWLPDSVRMGFIPPGFIHVPNGDLCIWATTLVSFCSGRRELGVFSHSGQTSHAEKAPSATSSFPSHSLTCVFLRYTDAWKRVLLGGYQTDKPRESLWAENITEAGWRRYYRHLSVLSLPLASATNNIC